MTIQSWKDSVDANRGIGSGGFRFLFRAAPTALLMWTCSFAPQTASAQDVTGLDNLEQIRARLIAQEQELNQLRQEIYNRDSAPSFGGVDVGQSASIDFASTNSAAEDGDVSKRLSSLEKAFQKDKDAAAKKKADDAKKPTMKISGRIHGDYWAFPETSPGINRFENPATGNDPEDRLTWRRVRIGAAGDIPDNMLYKMELEFAPGNDVEYRDLYIGWKELPYLQTVLVGNQKRPYGYDHLNSSRYNVFIERPSIVEAFNQDARRLGLASYGVSDDERYNWRFGVWNMQNVQTVTGYIGDSMQMELAGRFASTAWYDESSGGRGWYHWAVSGSVGRPDGDRNAIETNANEARYRTRPEMRTQGRWIDTGAIAGADSTALIGVEQVLNLGQFQFVGEYMASKVGREFGGPDVTFHGGYVQASYFLTGESMTWDRKTGCIDRVKPYQNFWLVDRCCGGHSAGWGAWQVAGRYSHADLTDGNILGGVSDIATFGVVWHWNAYASMQFNALYGEIEDHAPVAGFTGGHFTGYGARFRIDF